MKIAATTENSIFYRLVRPPWQKRAFVASSDKDGEEESGGKPINVKALLPQCRFGNRQAGLGRQDFLCGRVDPNFD